VSTKEQRDDFVRYKRDVKKEGKRFFPYAVFHDTVMSLFVVAVIIGLAALWFFTSGEEPGDAGILGPRYQSEADPGAIQFVPRPDWYFFFLFYLLRIFKWPESVILGTIGIPTIALILLMVVPFIDRRRERRLLRRPVAMVASVLVIASLGILTYKGATAKEGATGAEDAIPEWIVDGNLVENAEVVLSTDPDAAALGADPGDAETLIEDGAELLVQAGCLNCHLYRDVGAQNLGAPDLTEEGSRERGLEWQIGHLKEPATFTGGSLMPSFATLSDDQLLTLAVFLESSRGN
jgi:branched-subunit amino acid transport protein AzlD